jgi:hypothetical protein
MEEAVRTRAFATLFLSQWQHVTAMTAPIRGDVGEILPAMRNAMIDLGLVRVRLGIGL